MSLKENTLVKVVMLQGEQGEKGDTGDIDNIDEMLEALEDVVYTKEEMVDVVYPVGSIYISVNNVSPASIIGGVWSQLQDVFLMAYGSDENEYFALKADSDISTNALKVYMFQRIS